VDKMIREKLYAIKYTGREKYTSLCLDCHVKEMNGESFLRFLIPPDRGHSIEGIVTEETGDGFKFKSVGYEPGEWTFTEITLDNFRERFYKLVIDGKGIGQNVSTTEELNDWFNCEFPV